MDQESVITEEMRQHIGTVYGPTVYEIDKRWIRTFAEAIEDPNPLYHDEEYAKTTRFGGIVAPPTLILTIGFEQIQKKMDTFMPIDVGRLHGGTELECFQPVRLGDAITVSGKIAHVRERASNKLGRMVFLTFEINYKNQRQELVASCRQLLIGYQN